MKYGEIWTESLNNAFNNYVKYIISETRAKKPVFRSIFSLSEITSRLTSNREEKSLRHVAMDAKFLDDDKPKTSVKFQTLSILFCSIYFVKCWQTFLELNPKGPYLSLEKEKVFVLCSPTS